MAADESVVSSGQQAQTEPEPPAAPAAPVTAVLPAEGQPGALERLTADKREKKRRKIEERLRRQAYRPLDARERYRALRDTLDEGQELVDLGDHKARFALVLMGALNAVLFLVGLRSDVVSAVPENLRLWVGGYMVIYVLMALYFFLQAIESLRPRRAQFRVAYPGEDGYNDYPLGLRFFEDILRRDPEAYRSTWRQVHFGQLNAELTLQAYGLAQINHAKYTALRRLYMGLQIMTLQAGFLLAVAGYFVFVNSLGASGLIAGRKMAQVFGPPVSVPIDGFTETSGVAYHAQLDRIFVISDKGFLAELDRGGQLLWSGEIKGNLEDVTVHTPSGQLIILAEKHSELILFDPVKHLEMRRWRMNQTEVLGQTPGDKNQGFEGAFFLADEGPGNRGLIYLTHQRSPAMVVAMEFDPERPAGELNGETVVGRYTLGGYRDLTAITYAPILDRLLVIADAKDCLLVMRRDGTLETQVFLPGTQQEGLAFDRDGNLWMADDRAGLFRFDGAMGVLRQYLAGPFAPPEIPAGRKNTKMSKGLFPI